MKIVREIAEFIRSKKNLLIVSHARPDGDSLGTSLALAEGLRQLDKTVDVANADSVPRMFASLPGIEDMIVVNRIEAPYDALIVLECCSLERTGIQGLEPFAAVNIDHHLKNDRFATYNWVDPTAAAVGEMIFLLLDELDIRITPGIASNLYVALLTDTGSFQFANTSAETFRIAGELVALGAEPAQIAQNVLTNQPRSRLRLLCGVLQSLEFDPSGKVAWLTLTQEELTKTGSSADESEGMVNYALSVNGVRACAFFKEVGEQLYRVSLRSRGTEDVSEVAQFFGGGGHRNAAGMSLKGSLDEVKEQVVGRLSSLVASHEQRA